VSYEETSVGEDSGTTAHHPSPPGPQYFKRRGLHTIRRLGLYAAGGKRERTVFPKNQSREVRKSREKKRRRKMMMSKPPSRMGRK